MVYYVFEYIVSLYCPIHIVISWVPTCACSVKCPVRCRSGVHASEIRGNSLYLFLKGELKMKESTVDTISRIINEAMEKKDRYITLYFGEEGTTVTVYPLDEHNNGDGECG